MDKILGLGGSIHDFSACMIIGNRLNAIEDERITKIRYSVNTPNPCLPSVKYLLENLSTLESEICCLVYNDDLEEIVNSNFSFYKNKFAINHHLAHAYSSFFTSNFKQAAVLIADGAGSKKYINNPLDETRETTSFYFADGETIREIKKIYGTLDGINPISNLQTVMTNSIGEFYRVISEAIGLGWLQGPGKMMGMSSYGKADNKIIDYLLETVSFKDNGEFTINTNGKNGLIDKTFLLIDKIKNPKEDNFSLYATLAKCTQIVFEKLLLHTLDYLYNVTKIDNLCIAGGAALNSVANGIIKNKTKFKNIHIVPYPGDDGLSIGSAIWGYFNVASLNTTKYDKLERFTPSAFLSNKYTHDNIINALNDSCCNYKRVKAIASEIANYISNGKVVARFHGSSEFGPRALGHRSILADPRNPNMRDYINFKIKNREWYRPLAPAILEEYMHEYFELGCYSEWMQFVANVKKDYRAVLPAITHIDGSARLQTVSKNTNEDFYCIIDEFRQITGIPIVLNTSFNIDGHPIVETPIDAISAFKKSAIDVLAIEDFLVEK